MTEPIDITSLLYRIERMHNRIDFLEDRMTDMEARVPGPINNTTPAALTRDLENLTAFVGQLETLIRDIENDVDRLSETPPAFDPARIDRLEQRIEALSRAAVSETKNDRPQRDTSWHAFDPKDEFTLNFNDRVVIFNKSGQIVGPQYVSTPDWLNDVVAWRYATEVK